MRLVGPTVLFAAWAIHDVEEALAFPATCDDLADRTNIDSVRIDKHQSWAAVAIMAVIVTAACWRGQKTGGRSSMYRAALAGLEAHVYTHLAASASLRRYTAGVATALPIMLPGALIARKELDRRGHPLHMGDVVRGVCLLIPSAIVSQLMARKIRRRARGSRKSRS
ncbi:HXXEE domain-containing protein [Leucobacter chinensis]|uniref:HXXEE domain-containing protein n=1 Tax=Leucobacter chinensis TaxID=2851010 RepID=UPI001C22C2B4